jgi:oxygen-independent coproporphyrinogen-3 oxidase
VAALLADLDYRASQSSWNGRPLQSIYFGGGTPSIFSPRSIVKVIAEACSLFPIVSDAEVSIEVNPGSVDAEKLSALVDGGINRVSFGAQSLQLATLRCLGRVHTPEDVIDAMRAAHEAGIQNVNLDLMYGAPAQTVSALQEDVLAYLDLKPSHISAYGLTIEKGTPFYTSFRKGLLPLPKEDVVADMMEYLNQALPAAGFSHYEISNFAQPGMEARHNLAYWNGDDYLGIGAGAHSCVANFDGDRKLSARRWSNFALPARYMKHATSEGMAEGWSDTLKGPELMFEFFFLGLRKTSGVSIEDFRSQFGASVEEAYPALLQILAGEGLLALEHGRLRLTTRGLMLADSVIEQFASVEAPHSPAAPVGRSLSLAPA